MYQEELMLEYIRPRSKKPIGYLMVLAAVILLILGLFNDLRAKLAMPLYAVGAIIGICALLLLIEFSWEEDRGNESVQRMEALGLTQEAASQFHKTAEYLYRDDAIIFTRDFIFSRAYRSIVPYEDIIWCYCVFQDTRGNAFASLFRGYYLEYVTLSGPPLQLSKLTDKEKVEEMIRIIVSRKPDVLVGKNAENKIRYEALKNPKT